MFMLRNEYVYNQRISEDSGGTNVEEFRNFSAIFVPVSQGGFKSLLVFFGLGPGSKMRNLLNIGLLCLPDILFLGLADWFLPGGFLRCSVHVFFCSYFCTKIRDKSNFGPSATKDICVAS